MTLIQLLKPDFLLKFLWNLIIGVVLLHVGLRRRVRDPRSALGSNWRQVRSTSRKSTGIDYLKYRTILLPMITNSLNTRGNITNMKVYVICYLITERGLWYFTTLITLTGPNLNSIKLILNVTKFVKLRIFEELCNCKIKPQRTNWICLWHYYN